MITGHGIQLNVFGDEGPSKTIWDQVVSDRPVLIYDNSHHGILVNSKAIEVAGVTMR